MSTSESPTSRGRSRRRVGAGLATLVAAATAVVVGVGVGPAPALGQALNPRTGVWSEGRASALPTGQTLDVPTLDGPVAVSFSADGNAHVRAGSSPDAYQAVGYVHGRNRLFQMDMMRRQAAGRLAEVVGAGGLESDTFQVDLGLRRIADADFAALPADDPERVVLEAYADGVNAALAEEIAAGTLPMEFALMGYEPEPWSPADALLIQRLMAQTLSLNSRAPGFEILASHLGDKLLEWAPADHAAIPQLPIDAGPYTRLPLVPAPELEQVVVTAAEAEDSTVQAAPVPGEVSGTDGSYVEAAAAALDRLDSLPENAVHEMSNSNAWALSGEHTASGGAILASDPHLRHSIPAIWFQVELTAPDLHVAGVTIPGVPAVVIGKNDQVSWGITNSQHPQAFFYDEHTDPQRGDEYYWDGAWREMDVVRTSIPVKGAEPVTHTTRMTVHGPIITMQGQTVSLWWTGALESRSVGALLDMAHATEFAGFKEALRGWGAPAQNFVYADAAGNIGAVNAGYAPQVEAGTPYRPLLGTGGQDVAGLVPFDALPTVYNPDSGVVVSANQREVTGDYPYYWGTAYDYFDPGWRATAVHRLADDSTGVTLDDTQDWQLDVWDQQAELLMQSLLPALEDEPLDDREQRLYDQLKGWDHEMRADEVAPTVFTRTLHQFTFETFMPWWDQAGVPRDPEDALMFGESHGSEIAEVLRPTGTQLAVTDPDNPVFSLPDGTHRDAQDVLRIAFHRAVAGLAEKLGEDETTWTYGTGNRRMYPSITENPVLDVQVGEIDGSNRTLDASAQGVMRDGIPMLGTSGGGPSWRFAVDWGTDEAVAAYPGGQDENHLSPWSVNMLAEFGSGDLPALENDPQDTTTTKGRTWTLQP